MSQYVRSTRLHPTRYEFHTLWHTHSTRCQEDLFDEMTTADALTRYTCVVSTTSCSGCTLKLCVLSEVEISDP